jgi:hypothetical protein
MGKKVHVVQPGDYLTAIAYRYGTDVSTVLGDASNANLKEQRPNPEILAPLDVVSVPDDPPTYTSLKTGATNDFTSNPPKVKVNVVLQDADGTPLAGKAVTTEPSLGDAPLSTDGSGLLTLEVDVLARTIAVTVTETGARYELRVGNLDPHSTDTGIASRLRHMGYLGYDDAFLEDDPALAGIDVATVDFGPAVRAFQAANGQDDDGVLDDDLRAKIRDAHGC